MIKEIRIELVCPVCHSSLEATGEGSLCGRCGKAFPGPNDGSEDFLVEAGFNDEEDLERGLHEEKTAQVTIQGYLVPLLGRLFPGRPPREVSVLDIGCGVGKSVDLLREAGYDAWGIDSGRRPALWGRRANPNRLMLANGEALPFPGDVFDFVFCAGVIEHVGCDGDARTPSPGYAEKRLRFARENVRVVRKGGYLNYTCPNRLFPFDLFHRNVESNPLRFHWPWDPFLLDKGDFRRLFVGQCGCETVQSLPIRGYWGFLRLNHTILQRMGCRAARLWFDTIGSWPYLRGSFANPWLSILVRK